MLTFLIANWKYVLIVALLLAITGLFAAYQWQRVSLVKSEATIEEQAAVIAGRDAQIAEQKKNIAAIKKHQARIQTIWKEVEVVREVVKEVPVVSFAGNCEGGENAADAEKIKVAAAGIADLFNAAGVRSETAKPGDRGKVLPQAGASGPDGTAEPK